MSSEDADRELNNNGFKTVKSKKTIYLEKKKLQGKEPKPDSIANKKNDAQEDRRSSLRSYNKKGFYRKPQKNPPSQNTAAKFEFFNYQASEQEREANQIPLVINNKVKLFRIGKTSNVYTRNSKPVPTPHSYSDVVTGRVTRQSTKAGVQQAPIVTPPTATDNLAVLYEPIQTRSSTKMGNVADKNEVKDPVTAKPLNTQVQNENQSTLKEDLPSTSKDEQPSTSAADAETLSDNQAHKKPVWTKVTHKKMRHRIVRALPPGIDSVIVINQEPEDKLVQVEIPRRRYNASKPPAHRTRQMENSEQDSDSDRTESLPTENESVHAIKKSALLKKAKKKPKKQRSQTPNEDEASKSIRKKMGKGKYFKIMMKSKRLRRYSEELAANQPPSPNEKSSDDVIEEEEPVIEEDKNDLSEEVESVRILRSNKKIYDEKENSKDKKTKNTTNLKEKKEDKKERTESLRIVKTANKNKKKQGRRYKVSKRKE